MTCSSLLKKSILNTDSQPSDWLEPEAKTKPTNAYVFNCYYGDVKMAWHFIGVLLRTLILNNV